VDRHLAILAILIRLWGGLALLVGVSLLLLAAGAMAIVVDPSAAAVAFAAGVTAGMFAFLGACALLWGGGHVWAAARLKRRHPAGRAMTLALAVVNLLILPFGTALGGYALWVLLSNDGRHAFEGSPADVQ
jgi:hypothetical protein